MRKRGARKSLSPDQWRRLKRSNDPAVQARLKQLEMPVRNPAPCICERDPEWDPGQNMNESVRRIYGVQTTADVPVHLKDCPHSELANTTQTRGSLPPKRHRRPKHRNN